MLFFGVEELGVQMEEPFSILPLEDLTDRVVREMLLMIRAETTKDDPKIGEDAIQL